MCVSPILVIRCSRAGWGGGFLGELLVHKLLIAVFNLNGSKLRFFLETDFF